MSHSSIRSRAPKAASVAVRASMKANYGGDLKPEKTLRSELHKAGLRFRKHRRPVPGFRCEADIVFNSQQLCIFVDGCFWHGCPLHFKVPKRNSGWWKEKIAATQLRDKLQGDFLQRSGWRVMRIWEHEVQKALPAIVSAIRDALRS